MLKYKTKGLFSIIEQKREVKLKLGPTKIKLKKNSSKSFIRVQVVNTYVTCEHQISDAIQGTHSKAVI